MARFSLRLRRRKPQPRVYRRRRKASLKEIIDFVSITYFSGIASKIVKTFDLEKQLAQAGITIYPLLYAARWLLYTLITAVLAIYSIIIIAILPLPLAVKVIAGLIIGLTPLFVFAWMLIYPASKKEERRTGVDTELPFFAAYLTTMVRAGVPVGKVIERVSNLKIFKAMRREAQLIMRNVRLLGKNPLDAIEENALEHPSSKYRDFMLGYVTSVKTGGDVLHYLEIRTQDIFTTRMNEMRLIAERMSMFTEIYVTLAVIMTLVFYIFFTIQAIFPAGAAPGTGVAQLALFSFVFLPLLTVLLLWMIHSSQPKTPVEYKAPYRALISVGLPAAIILFPILFAVTGAYRLITEGALDYASILGFTITLGGTLIALSLPPAIIHIREMRKTRNLGEAIASFLRDLTEVRKTGLSPEKSILAVASRSYGPLDPILKRIYTALSLGLELERAVARAVRGYKDWLLLTNMRFLVDSIEVGGGSPETLESLARYAHNLTELDKEFRKKLRSYIFMPYMGAILVAGSSIMVLAFTAQSLALAPEGGAGFGGGQITLEQLGQISLLLSLGAVFNAWLMGIVAGKIQDGRIAGGFVHSIILVIITIITVAVTLRGVPLTEEQLAQLAQQGTALILHLLTP